MNKRTNAADRKAERKALRKSREAAATPVLTPPEADLKRLVRKLSKPKNMRALISLAGAIVQLSGAAQKEAAKRA